VIALSDQSIAPQHKEIFAGIDLYQSGMLAIVPNSLVGETQSSGGSNEAHLLRPYQLYMVSRAMGAITVFA
jgi:hypothetical protein